MGTENKPQLVLVGGGHSHVLALLQLARVHGNAYGITLISNTASSPYSGMLPGVLAGHFAAPDIFIDLEVLCQRCGVDFICDRVTALDPDRQQLTTAGGRVITWHRLSLDIGITPDLSVPGAPQHCLPVKPILGFLVQWQQRIALWQKQGSAPRLVTVGGGAGSVEVALALAHRLRQARIKAASQHLVIGSSLLPGHSAGVKRRVRRCLQRAGINVVTERVNRVEADGLFLADGQYLPSDASLWCTHAQAADWPAAAGLATDTRGFVRVTPALQSASHPHVFASGDMATVEGAQRPKAGVFAVRQAPVLAVNLHGAMTGQPLQPWRPQQRFLSLLATGPEHAIASWGPLAMAGHWIWFWKRWIDQRFMAQFPRPKALPQTGSRLNACDRAG